MEFLIAFALLWILWLVSSRKRQRFWIQVGAIILSVCWILVSPWGTKVALWSLTHSLPADQGKPIDAIVVLGRGPELRPDRSDIVWRLWQDHRPPKIFASGMLDARIIVESLQERGVPSTILSGEECSQSTQENALFTSVLLKPQGVNTILLVTDAPHMWRSLLIFQQEGFEVIPHATELPVFWKSRRQMLTIGRESFALAQYLVGSRLNINVNTNFDRPPVTSLDAASSRLAEWKCRV